MMYAEDDSADVFAIPDFWDPPQWELPKDTTSFFALDLTAEEEDKGSPLWSLPNDRPNKVFELPAIDPIPEQEEPSTVDAPEPEEHSPPERDFDLDELWFALDKPVKKAPEFKTWNSFESPKSPSTKPIFISEAGPAAFDALMELEGDPLKIGSSDFSVVEAGPYCNALLALALGRESVFFSWEEESKSFKPALPRIRVSAYTGNTIQEVQRSCLKCGHTYRRLRLFVDTTYQRNATPCRVALASSVDKALLVIQSSIALHHQSPRSILQVQSLVSQTYTILKQFDSLVSKIRREHLDEDVFVIVFQQAQSAEYAEVHLRDMMREVLRRVSRPWIELVEEWIGTRREVGVPLGKHEVGRSRGFIKVESETYIDDFGDEVEEVDFRLDAERIPSFMPDDIVKSLFEVGRNLRFIRTSHPKHPLAQSSVISTSRPPLVEWLFDWDAIVELESRIHSYEHTLRAAIQQPASEQLAKVDVPGLPMEVSAGYQLQFFGLDEGQLQSRLDSSLQDFAQPMGDSTSEDPLGIIIRERLSDVTTEVGNAGTDFTPHWSLLPVLSFGSIISAQSRVVGRESLKLLFASHGLREHLKLQKEFQLLGNGFFCSRLSHALFDPDLETAERQTGVAHQGGVMGLRLSGRDTWPPASSELRLALMGVLVESYEGPVYESLSRPRDGEANELPGDLSFGVRSLSNDEIDKCMDPDGLEALDFLRLSYKPPPALGSVITPIIIVQYDRIFKLLLRVLRMQYTVNRLFRDITARESGWQDIEDVSVRFCFEARHFIASISSYIFDTGIEMPWQAFGTLVDQVEADLKGDDMEEQAGSAISPDRLREYHSQVLDRIMLALLLRKRQQPVLKLLEDIFRAILEFAKYARLRVDMRRARSQGESTAKGLYKIFRRNVEVFLTVCKGLSEKGDYGAKKDTLEKLEQSITLTLQEIDSNFSKAHRIVTSSILPIVEQYGENSRNVWEASKFWKQFFEASANVSLSGYEELANDDDETGVGEESAVQDGSTAQYATPRRGGNSAEDETITSTAESTFQPEESMIGGDDDLTGSTPRVPKTKTIQTQFSSLESPYEALKRELKGEPPAPYEEDDEDEDIGLGEDSTVLFAQHTARLPDMSMTPRSSLAPPQSAKQHKDPLMHRMLDKTFRIQATPHKGPTYRVSPLKREMKPKEEEDVPSWRRQDSPLSSPVMAVPTLRSEAFMSPAKSRRLAAATAAASSGPRTPGVSVQTPATGRKTKDVFAGKPYFKSTFDDDTTTTDIGAGVLSKDKYEINWESDSDEDQALYGGMSPPKTIQFALPQSKLLQTPAREASKRIVDDILMTAGAEPESSEYSPTMVKMNEDILNESF
ncbi:Spc97/Spc98 family protein [Colletotrichum karsti]|uniref:DASH complex subunit ASK1 n=1 Tax=Colletotrichum karsti TaxID=1095194 RepID=A0A9P6IEH3_9PEZI|nr:Spc97/Spc98 family protein [Colletotrichum karsti]KAF9881359.1 Spc97/Spc98 family protein [Colletotrichum karsti]